VGTGRERKIRMINCDEYNKKAIVGSFLCILFFLIGPYMGEDWMSIY
jgi:hypothetical protein